MRDEFIFWDLFQTHAHDLFKFSLVDFSGEVALGSALFFITSYIKYIKCQKGAKKEPVNVRKQTNVSRRAQPGQKNVAEGHANVPMVDVTFTVGPRTI
jgi:hypothetical protein